MKEYKVTVNEYGNVRWYKPGTDELHREDGPAVEWADGSKFWYINGEQLTEQEFKDMLSDRNAFILKKAAQILEDNFGRQV